MSAKLTAADFKRKKREGEALALLTAYDYFTARTIEKAGLDAVLVGDSLAMVALGYDNTLPVTMDEMIHHTKAVRRAAPNTFVIGDLPYEASRESASRMAKAAERFLDEGGCDAVKVEGAERVALEAIRLMRRKKIEVMGHLGLLPQELSVKGEPFRLQGANADSAKRIVEASRRLESLGIFSLVLECIPAALATQITGEVRAATIGIGAGRGCDGQVLVTDDVLGRYDQLRPKFVKRYLDSSQLTHEALVRFKNEVKQGEFPAPQHTFKGPS